MQALSLHALTGGGIQHLFRSNGALQPAISAWNSLPSASRPSVLALTRLAGGLIATGNSARSRNIRRLGILLMQRRWFFRARDGGACLWRTFIGWLEDYQARSEHQQVEQSLRACANVMRKDRVHEDIEGREEEGVADAVKNLDRDDERLVFRLVEEGEHGEAHRMTEDAENHRPFPADFLEHSAEDEHRRALSHLADGGDPHDPIDGNLHAVFDATAHTD